jgi:hypothetical protein
MNNTNMLSTYNRGGSHQNVSSSSSLSYHKKRSKIKNFGANNNDYVYPDNAIINSRYSRWSKGAFNKIWIYVRRIVNHVHF